MVKLTVVYKEGKDEIEVPAGSNLRKVLLEHGHSPYASVTKRLNCGGNGLCATCGVEILEGVPTAVHWHDKAASRFRYPRLSCQIKVEEAMVVRMMWEKKVWGKRLSQK